MRPRHPRATALGPHVCRPVAEEPRVPGAARPISEEWPRVETCTPCGRDDDGTGSCVGRDRRVGRVPPWPNGVDQRRRMEVPSDQLRTRRGWTVAVDLAGEVPIGRIPTTDTGAGIELFARLALIRLTSSEGKASADDARTLQTIKPGNCPSPPVPGSVTADQLVPWGEHRRSDRHHWTAAWGRKS
jgi:hypothetical protein